MSCTAAVGNPAVMNAEATITDFMRAGSTNVTLLRKLLDGTARIVAQFKDYTNVAQVPLSDLKANPFQASLAKVLPTEDADEITRKKKEEDHAAIVKVVQSLQLQTIVVRGSRKACILSNTMYRERDVFDRFTLDKINTTSVILKSGEYRFELKMGK